MGPNLPFRSPPFFTSSLYDVSILYQQSPTVQSPSTLSNSIAMPPLFSWSKKSCEINHFGLFLYYTTFDICPHIVRETLLNHMLTDDEEFVKDGFTTTGPMRTRPNTTFIFSNIIRYR